MEFNYPAVITSGGLQLADTNGATGEHFLELTTAIVSAYVEKNAIGPADVPRLVRDIHAVLSGLRRPALPVEEAAAPAVSIRKSITPDYLICLDDGKQFKILKRHLKQLGMSPQQYRSKWNLPADYPMVAPNYSTLRSGLAIGCPTHHR